MATKSHSSSMNDSPRIFLSYARKDGEDFARKLRQKLIEQKFSLWQDRTQMEGGKDWWDQITQALRQVEYMVLVMTEAALASPVVRKEWRQARQEGVGVIPVFGQPNLDLSQLPRWMRDVHWVNTDVPEQWTRFIRTLESSHQRTRVPFMADDLPVDYVLRAKEFEDLAESLLDPQKEEPIAITAALKGAGGYGKTTLAKGLCHDERIQDAFHDGILWVTLGEEPNIMAGLTKLYAALTEERPNFVDQDDASNRLAEVLEDKDCVMVIDDVWNAAHVPPFLRGGKRCARIITTRDSGTLPPSAKLRVDVDAMRLREAAALLAFELPHEEEAALEALAKDLGEWPFLLKLVNATLRDRVNGMGQDLPAALEYVRKALKKRGLTAFDARNPVERNQAVAVTLRSSFDHLKEDELARYQELAIFPEDVEIPLPAITKLWGVTGDLDDFDTEELCTRLNQLSLVLRYDPTTQRIQLHDVVRTYLEEQVAPQLPTLHGQFLDSYDVQDDPAKAAQDPYLVRHVAYHLVKAERWEELKQLLLNVDWLYAKLEVLDVPALLSDFVELNQEKAISLVHGAIQLSAHIVGKDASQLIGQLLGRLQPISLPEIQKLVSRAKAWRKGPWLHPLYGNLIQPGGPLIRTLSGHSGWVRGVSVTPDGTRALTASRDATCKVWDLTTGQEVFTLRGHSGWVQAVSVTPDGTRALTASGDATC
ncbi:MAG: TIR domain-containing protein, partial [Nitrospirota bacterium]|nr:TIR domain-containing protein [Nitrospirota bacterium]